MYKRQHAHYDDERFEEDRDALITNYPDIAKKIRDEYRFGELQPELVQRILQS